MKCVLSNLVNESGEWVSSFQSLSRVWLLATPWTTAHQASLSITNSRSPPKPMSIESVMPSNHLILYHPLLLFLNICYFLETMQLQLERNFKWIKKKSDYEGFFGEGNGNPLQCSCLENPRDGGAWWAAASGVAQSHTRQKRLSSSSNRMKVSWVALLKGVIELPGLVISTISMTYFTYMYCCLGTGMDTKASPISL